MNRRVIRLVEENKVSGPSLSFFFLLKLYILFRWLVWCLIGFILFLLNESVDVGRWEGSWINCLLIAVQNSDKIMLLDSTIPVPVQWQKLLSFSIKVSVFSKWTRQHGY